MLRLLPPPSKQEENAASMLPDQGKSDTDRDRTPGEHPGLEDRVLVERFLEAKGEDPARPRSPAEMESAFRMLLVRYQERVHKLVFRYTKDPLEAEDVTQEVFLKLYRKLDGFQWDSAFYTWLYRIAVNTAVDYMGKRRRRPVQLSEDVTKLGGGSAGGPAGETASPPDADLLREERAAVTHRILEELPEPYRTVLTLREFEDLSYLEIAEVLGCSLGTVESRLFRARARFRRILEDRYPELLA